MINLIYTGKKALQVNQAHLETIAHNIANVNTPGYSRQRVIQESSIPISDSSRTLGTGVQISEVKRLRDESLDVQYRRENKHSGYWDTMSAKTMQIEKVFNEPSDNGLTAKMNSFWNSWDELSNNPSGPTGMVAREALLVNSEEMVAEFNRIDNDLQSRRTDINTEIENTTTTLNQIFSEMATLNEKIMQSEINGGASGDLLDKFDNLVDELSEYGDAKVVINSDKRRSVFFGTDEVVDHDFYREVMTTPNAQDGSDISTLRIVYRDNQTEFSTLTSGKINALYEIRDEVIPEYQENLDELAVKLAETVNEIHQQGYDLQDPPSKHHHFFNEEVTGAGDIEISNDIKNNPDFIAASLEGEPGDNRIALEIAELRHLSSMNEAQSFNEFYGSLLFKVGSDSYVSQNNSSTYSSTTSQLDSFRESVKGVSIDEEAAMLIQYQQTYQAAAKIIQAAEEALATVIGLIN